MPLQQKFNKFSTQAPISAVFDFTDFESGVGYVAYNGYNTADSSTVDYHMDKNTFFSDSVESEGSFTGSGGTFFKALELDFDTSPFNIPKTINGDIIVNMTLAHKLNSANNIDSRGVVSVYIVDGSGETQIGSTVTSKSYSAASNNAWKSSNFTVVIPIVKQIVKSGQWIRLKIEHWGRTTAGFVTTSLGHSPNNLTGNIDPATQDSNYNQTLLNAPFLIE